MKTMCCRFGWIAMACFGIFAAENEGPVYVGIDFGMKPMPRYGFGHLVAVDKGRQSVLAIRKDGTVAYSSAVQLPSERLSMIHEAAVDVDGRVAVTATVNSKQMVIAWLDGWGKVEKMALTGNYMVVRMQFDREGRLWTLGWVRDAKDWSPQNEEVMRVYDRGGQMVKKFYPQPGLRNLGEMAPTEKGMGVLIWDQKQYVEFDENGAVVRSAGLPDKRGFVNWGMAIGLQGEPLVRGRWYKGETGEAYEVGLLSYDWNKGAWEKAAINDSIGKRSLWGNASKEELALYDHASMSLVRLRLE
jgi:hypothetical protein